jgi:F-type H+-transporting ATPase subunit delta
MNTGSIARRYAKALFSLALEKGRAEPWSNSLQGLKAAVEGSPDLRDVLANPVYSREQRRAIVEKLAHALSLDEEPASLLFLLGDRNRLAYLSGVVDTFRDYADQHLGRLRARVTSAVRLDDGAAQAIADELSKKTKAKVLLDRVVDPGILGGVVAQVGSLVYDGSVRTQLEDLRKQLKQ